RCVGKRVVVIVPRAKHPVQGHDGKEHVRTEVHLLFAINGRLAERRLVQGSSGKVLYRERYGADGMVRLLDGRGEELWVQRRAVGPAGKPNLRPRLKHLVVLPLPLRTGNHVLQTQKRAKTPAVEKLSEEDAQALLAAHFGSQASSAGDNLFRHRFQARGDHRLGCYTL